MHDPPAVKGSGPDVTEDASRPMAPGTFGVRILGVTEVVLLGYQDGVVEPTLGLRRTRSRRRWARPS
jgi:hypothetical protein